jgi:hypothetical protein
MPNMKSSVETAKFEDRPVLKFYLPEHNTPLLTFGVVKAHVIMEHVNAIRDFCKQNPRKAGRAN